MLVAASPAYASEGKDLYTNCKQDESWCSAYFSGFIDAYTKEGTYLGSEYCLPRVGHGKSFTVTLSDLREAIIQYGDQVQSDTHETGQSSAFNMSANWFIATAFSRQWPCPNKGAFM